MPGGPVVGLFVAALLLFAVGSVPSSVTPDHRVVADGEIAAVAPVYGAVSAAGAGAKPVTIILGPDWALTAVLLVSVVAALRTVVASCRRAPWCRGRAPPVPAG